MTRNPTSFKLIPVSTDPREFVRVLEFKTIRGIRKILLNDGPAARLVMEDGTQYVLRPQFRLGDRMLVLAPNIMGTSRPITGVLQHEGRTTYSLYLKHRLETLAIITTTNHARGGGDNPDRSVFPIELLELIDTERNAA